MAPHFTLRQLEYLVAVADCGSVALAAEREHVSSPSVSAAISQLEDAFGLALFVRRHAQGLSPTEAGRQFVAEARKVLDGAARLVDRAGEISGRVAGPLAIGCLQTFAQVLLPRLRRGFTTAYPQVDFRQAEMNQAEIFDALRHARLDLALSYDLDIPSDLAFHPLLTLAPYALLPQHHPLTRLPEVPLSALAKEPMVLLDLPFSSDYFLGLFAEAGLKPSIAERTRDMGVMRAMVAHGFGYGIANIPFGTDRAPDGTQLAQRPLSGPVRPMQIGLIRAQGGPVRRVVEAFLDHARADLLAHALPPLDP